MLTGTEDENVVKDAIRYGAQDYLNKSSISNLTLEVAMIKAKEFFELKRKHQAASLLLEHTQRLESVGKLTGGIAHDFNNILTILMGNIKLLGMKLESETLEQNDEIYQKLSLLEKTTQRGANLVKRLMIFSRQHKLDPINVNINSMILDLVSMLKRTLSDEINFITDLSDNLPEIHIDLAMLENAIINIAVNAKDAMPDGGTISFKTETVTKEQITKIHKNAVLRDHIKLSIKDDGVGIKEDVIEHIFDPFFYD